MRCIGDSRERVIEGQLRIKELSSYLEKIGTEKTVWISEDATAIVPKVNYDVVSDSIVGLVLPIDEQTGCPIPLSHRASTTDEIVANMRKAKASYVYLVMAQPLDERFPPFVLFNSESDINVVQESNHIATKFRNRILNVNNLPMGTHKVSVEHLKKLLNVDKAIQYSWS